MTETLDKVAAGGVLANKGWVATQVLEDFGGE